LDILARLMEQPHGRVHLNIEPLGGAVADVAADATAFPHRQTSFAIQSQVLLRDGDDKKVLLASNEAMRWVLQPLANGGVYLNYPDLTLSDWGRRYWGSNLPRLKSIKARYDPDNVFTHAQSLERA
ncbi:MAG: BBE domain-containing protein, partial [Pseudomonadota bacterium]